MNEYSISVVIPNYNNEKYLRKCIESVLEQTYPVEEIIVVDDCSTDNSLQVLQNLASVYHNLRCIPLEKNGRVSHARNIGLHAVRTPYVTFLDADDFYWNKQKIENEMHLIRHFKEKHNRVIGAYSKIVLVTADGVRLTPLAFSDRHYLTGNIHKKILTEKYHFTIMRDYCLPTACIKAVGGYDESNSLYEDLELLIRLSKEIEFYYTKDAGTAYRQTSNGLSSKPANEHLRKKQEIFDMHTKDFNKSKKAKYLFLRKIHHLENKQIIAWLRVKRKYNALKGRFFKHD